MKRAVDLIVAVALGVILAPLALMMALVIQLESRGPLLYNSQRVGKDGKLFYYHRLRLVKGSPYDPPPYDLTRFGHFVGSLSLDEIPVLWNIIRGEMSFVGPRAAKPEEVVLTDPDWLKILSIRPGLLGLGGVRFVGVYNQTSIKERIQPEVFYAENQSFLMDARIVLKSLGFWVRMGHPKGGY